MRRAAGVPQCLAFPAELSPPHCCLSGFNAGSAVAANALAGVAMATTQIATGAAGMSWMFVEWFMKGKPTLMSVISGAVAGLVAITPAAGYVDCNGAIIMGFITGIVCSQTIRLKHVFGYDDALDAFGVHGMGGALGSILTGLFAQPKLNNFYPVRPGGAASCKLISRRPPAAPPQGCPYSGEPCGGPGTQRVSGAFYDHLLSTNYGGKNRHGKQIGLQLYGIVVVGSYSAFASFILLKIIDKIMGLRVSVHDEVEGLDVSVHGETVYYGSEARARRARERFFATDVYPSCIQDLKPPFQAGLEESVSHANGNGERLVGHEVEIGSVEKSIA